MELCLTKAKNLMFCIRKVRNYYVMPGFLVLFVNLITPIRSHVVFQYCNSLYKSTDSSLGSKVTDVSTVFFSGNEVDFFKVFEWPEYVLTIIVTTTWTHGVLKSC
jgi:hypothetical protein